MTGCLTVVPAGWKRPIAQDDRADLDEGEADRGDRRVMWRKIKGFREPERDRAGEAAELVFGLGLGRKEVGVGAGQGELSKSDAPKATAFGGEYFLGEGLEAVEPDGFTDADEVDLGDDGFGRREGRGIGGGAVQRKWRSTGNDELGDSVREAMKPVFEFGAVKLEENVEDVLRGVGLAEGEVGLEEIEAGSGAVFLGIVTRGDEFDDAGDVTRRAEVTGNGDEDIGAIARRSEDLFVDRKGTGKITSIEPFARRREAREQIARSDTGYGCGRRSGRGGRGRSGLS